MPEKPPSSAMIRMIRMMAPTLMIEFPSFSSGLRPAHFAVDGEAKNQEHEEDHGKDVEQNAGHFRACRSQVREAEQGRHQRHQQHDHGPLEDCHGSFSGTITGRRGLGSASDAAGSGCAGTRDTRDTGFLRTQYTRYQSKRAGVTLVTSAPGAVG